MAKDAHFDGNVAGCNIHTVREGACPKTGSCNYQTACTWAYPKPWEAHHILCVHAVNAYPTVEDYESCIAEIGDTYQATSWCINQSPNMIALPLKSTYVAEIVIRGLNLPAHNLHHNCTLGFTDEVLSKIDSTIWEKVKEAVENASEDHFTPKEVSTQLTDLQTYFRGQLALRGLR
jgi:hypothetical protein